MRYHNITRDDMLHKGDWITVNSVDANGIVEDMSLTTVKVRNVDNTSNRRYFFNGLFPHIMIPPL